MRSSFIASRMLALACAFILVLCLSIVIASDGAAADSDPDQSICAAGSHSGNGQDSPSFHVYIYGVTLTWANILGNGPDNWSGSVGVVSITHERSDSSAHSRAATAGDYTNNSNYGWHTKLPDGGFEIFVNRHALLQGGGQENLGAWGRSTAVHEFGHALNLDDNPPTSLVSIMKYDRLRTHIFPWPHDIACVNDHYL